MSDEQAIEKLQILIDFFKELNILFDKICYK